MDSHHFNPTILREYDVRGRVNDNLSTKDAAALGRAFGSVVMRESPGNRTVCVGYDGRISSPELEAALVDGLRRSGIDVVRIGRGPTPLLYFSVFHLNAGGGVMVTGSHNPKDQNGFKLMFGKRSFHSTNIARLGPIAAAADYTNGPGSVRDTQPFNAYIEALVAAASTKRPLTVAWDPGNGAAGEVVEALVKRLPGKHFVINETIDGNFPAHHPDPAHEENLMQLRELVAKNRCDLGFAFDGDGDRLGVLDAKGRVVWADQLLALLAREVIRAQPGAPVIADVKSSQMLFDEVQRLGGKPVMWRTGHALIKDRMADLAAPLAGELSGHIFFADRYFGFDDALYAAVRVLTMVGSGTESMATMADSLPRWSATPELRLHCPEDRKNQVVVELRTRLRESGASVVDIDGVRVTTPQGWWLVRASNTEAALVARAESRNAEGLATVRAHLAAELARSGVVLPNS